MSLWIFVCFYRNNGNCKLFFTSNCTQYNYHNTNMLRCSFFRALSPPPHSHTHTHLYKRIAITRTVLETIATCRKLLLPFHTVLTPVAFICAWQPYGETRQNEGNKTINSIFPKCFMRCDYPQLPQFFFVSFFCARNMINVS